MRTGVHRCLSLLLLIALLPIWPASSARSAVASATASTSHAAAPVTVPSIESTTSGPCALYPIAVYQGTLDAAAPGQEIVDILQGAGAGNFGWLSWTGQQSAPVLATSLTPPGNSHTYSNPTNPQDHQVSVDDWVPGTSGVTSSSAVRAALDHLLTIEAIVPVWDTATGNGSTLRYHIVTFARVQLTAYQLPAKNRISARFLSWHTCAAAPPTPTPTSTVTPTPTPTPTTPTPTPQPINQAPLVDAGPDQRVDGLTATLPLTGTVQDDGLPSATLTQIWSLVSGPGTVTFAEPHRALTTATFSVPGVYEVRLSASDGDAEVSDTALIVLLPENQPPVVDAGPDQVIPSPLTVLPLEGNVVDDGQPITGTLSFQWELVSGPGTVTFGTPDQPTGTAEFSAPGVYSLRLSASDGLLSDADETQITVYEILPTSAPPTATPTPTITNTPTATLTPTNTPTPTATPINQPPFVDAGADQTLTLPTVTADLDGRAIDDGFPADGSVQILWSQVSGPGPVTFADAAAAATTATFTMAGIYVLRLTASDSVLSASDDVVITITNPTSTQPGGIFITGHDPDYHAYAGGNRLGSQHIIQRSIDYVTWGRANPRILLVTDLRNPNGDQSDPRRGMQAAGFNSYTLADYGSGTAGVLDLRTVNFSAYDVVVIASDYGGWLRQEELDILNSRSAELLNFINAGGGVVAFNESGTRTAGGGVYTGTTRDRFKFIPFVVSVVGLNQSEVGIIVTAAGTAMGLINSDVNGNASHSVFQQTGGMDVINVDSRGQFLSLAIRGQNLSPGGVGNNPPTVSAGPDQQVLLTNMPITLQGSASDDGFPRNSTVALAWTQVSGPAPVTFSAPTSATTTVNATVPGTYVLRLTGSDSQLTSSDYVTLTVLREPPPPTMTPTPTNTPTVTPTPTNTPMATSTPTATPTPVPPPPQLAVPGWIAGPTNGGTVSGTVPITLTQGINLVSGTLDYWPVDQPSQITTVATDINAPGGTTIGTLDTTQLANGTYTIRLRGTADDGRTLASGIQITVSGEYKPGRVRFSLTDLTVPLRGQPITIGRTYDSLERDRVGDFGYGWTLSISSPRLEVDSRNNVTLTQPNGKRVTFFFTPQAYGSVFSFLLKPAYTPEPGTYGSLTANGCPLLARSGARVLCYLATAEYRPTIYTYTDPYGGVYTMSANGSLQSIKEVNGSVLTFSRNGITSTSDQRAVTFVRDAQHQNRITAIQVKDATGTITTQYRYSYTDAGDLDTVTVPPAEPGQPNPVIRYFYDPAQPHLYQGVKDPLGRTTVISTYYTSPVEKAGRLKSITERVDANTSLTFTYDYDLTNNTITTTNPDGGRVVERYLGLTLPPSVRGGTAFKLTSQTVDVRVENGERKTHTTRYGYDANLNLTSVGLPDPVTGAPTPPSSTPGVCAERNICYTYDARGNQTKVTNALGKTTLIEYNQFNARTKVTDPLGNVKTLAYDARGNFMRMSDSLGVLGGYTYDAYGNTLTRYIGNDPNKATSYTYDEYGNLLTETDPLGNVTQYDGYDAFGRFSRITQPSANGPARVTQYEYDSLGRVTHTTVPLNDGSGRQMVSLVSYDLNGNQTRMRDETTGWTTSFSYYDNNRVKTVTHADGTTTTYTYDWRGNVLTETDQAGHVTRSTYDLAGELTSVITADGTASATTTAYTYDLAGRQTAITDPLNRTTQMEYDAGDRVRSVIDPLHGSANPTEYHYDDTGRPVTVVSPTGTQRSLGFDARGFPTTVTDSSGTMTQTVRREHDGLGHITKEIDANGKATQYRYDDMGHLIGVIDALQQETRYELDGFGNLLAITDAKQQTTRFSYDVLGRITQKIWPDQSVEQFSYEIQSGSTPASTYQKISHRLTDGNVNLSYLNALGQLTETRTFDGQVTTYAYTATGQPQEVHDQRGTTCYRYDEQDRIAEINQLGIAQGVTCGQSPSQQRVTYSYDALGQRTNVAATIGLATTNTSYAYDAGGRVCSVTTAATPTPCGVTNSSTFAYSYDDVGRTQRLTYPNGIIATATFDALYRLTRIAQTFNGQTIASYSYTLDATGRRTRLEEADGSVTTWTYDDGYRLLREQRQAGGPNPSASASWDLRYEYDAVGNRTKQTSVTGATSQIMTYSYKANQLDQLDTITLPDGNSLSYTYDQRGNLTSDGVATYSYDAADQLTGVSLADGTTASYRYDTEGRRIQQTVGGNTTNYLWDETSKYGDVLAESNSVGTMQTSYILGGATLLGQTRGGTTQYLLPDGQGNTRALATSSGTIAERYLYEAFGALRDRSTTPQTGYLYTGQQFDAATNLYYLRARYYAPSTGRFLSRDTVYGGLSDPSQHNRYTYGANNPVNGADPSGHVFIEYVATNHINHKMAKAHAAYEAGASPAIGPDMIALHVEALLSLGTDVIIVTAWNLMTITIPEAFGFDMSWFESKITLGVGTVYHLGGYLPKPHTVTKGVTINAYCWNSAASQLPWKVFCPDNLSYTQGLKNVIAAGIGILTKTLWPGSDAVVIDKKTQTVNPWDSNLEGKPDHAEMIIARWALGAYGGYPTPHRVLSIAASRPACDGSREDQRWPDRTPCAAALPKLRLLDTLLFEATKFGHGLQF